MEFVPRVEVSIFSINKHKQKQITTNHILQCSIKQLDYELEISIAHRN